MSTSRPTRRRAWTWTRPRHQLNAAPPAALGPAGGPGAPGVVPEPGGADADRADGRRRTRPRSIGKVNALAAWLSSPLFTYNAAAPPVDSPDLPAQVPDHGPPGRVRAVGVRDDGAHPAAGHPGPAGGRLHRGHPDLGKHLRGQDRRRARVDRGVLRGLRLAQVRGHAGRRRRERTAQQLPDRDATGTDVPPTTPGSIGSSVGADQGPADGRGPGQQDRRRRGRIGRRPVGQVRRDALGRDRSGRARRHRAGVRGHRDRGPARAPAAVGPCPGRGQAAPSGEPDQRGAGGGRGRDRRAGAVPAAVPYLRAGPAGRLGDGRHRLRRGRRVRARGAGRDPDRRAAVALAAGRRRREPGPHRLA